MVAAMRARSRAGGLGARSRRTGSGVISGGLLVLGAIRTYFRAPEKKK